jgi:hypothetical protein
VCTAEQSGHRHLFTHTFMSNPAKLRLTYPCPHSLVPPHRGHTSGLAHAYFFPCAANSFTSTSVWIIS